MTTPYRIACYSPAGKLQGLVAPVHLRFATREEAETARLRYAAKYDGCAFRVVEIGARGRIIGKDA